MTRPDRRDRRSGTATYQQIVDQAKHALRLGKRYRRGWALRDRTFESPSS
ncbi:hypothetical protein [Kibdelosporangium persicum]|nr:hypothetical protein [Kibdelosporangium persicum]